MSQCEHRSVRVGRIDVTACDVCHQVEWRSLAGPVDPAEAITALFGSYELMGALDALGAPGRQVLAYRPPRSKKRSHLEAFPARVWLRASPDLWMSHDGDTLLLAPTRGIVFENLTRGA